MPITWAMTRNFPGPLIALHASGGVSLVAGASTPTRRASAARLAETLPTGRRPLSYSTPGYRCMVEPLFSPDPATPAEGSRHAQQRRVASTSVAAWRGNYQRLAAKDDP